MGEVLSPTVTPVTKISCLLHLRDGFDVTAFGDLADPHCGFVAGPTEEGHDGGEAFGVVVVLALDWDGEDFGEEVVGCDAPLTVAVCVRCDSELAVDSLSFDGPRCQT